jgi:hypothetical protein
MEGVKRMAIIAKEEAGTAFAPIEAGSYPARCYGVVLIGTSYDEMYKKTQCKVLLQFEFPSETIDAPESEYHGQPYGLSKFYTLSLHEKSNLRADLERWRNKPFTQEELNGFDLKNVIGAPCMIAVTKKDNGKSQISSVSALVKGMKVAPQINPTRYFDFDDMTHFDDLPNGIQDLIKKSDEYRLKFESGSGQAQGMEEPPPTFDESDEIPF